MKNIRKWLSALVCAAMVCSAVSVSAFAENEPDTSAEQASAETVESAAPAEEIPEEAEVDSDTTAEDESAQVAEEEQDTTSAITAQTEELTAAGTEYHITTAAELAAVANDLTGVYYLDNDIDLSSYDEWTPIGTGTGDGQYFSGVFDGQGHSITGLSMTANGYSYSGLFGVSHGVIKNVNVEVNIVDAISAGGLVGYLYNGTVENCSASGSIIGTTDIGGLVGYMQASDSGNQAIIRNCYSMASATSTSSTEEDGCGGLVGDMYGYNTAPARIFTSYAAGKVTKTGTSGVGGIVGYEHVGNKWSSDGTTAIVASYYCSSTTKQGDENRGFAATSSEMKKENTYANWDFDNIWAISSSANSGYPYLKLSNDYNSFFLAGSGIKGDPYIITTESELAAIARNEITNNYTSYYMLANDIILSSNYWTPIGGNGMPNFSGEFDGNGHTISNVSLIVPAYYDVGLFGCVTGTIKNLNVVADISDVYTAGSLVGFLYNGTVENCSASGSIAGTRDIGGLVGYMQASDSGNQAIIRNCYSMASAISTSSTEEDGCGGLVGDMYGYNTAPARIFTSYAAGKVTKTGTSGVGGIVGYKHVGNKWSSDGTTAIVASYYCSSTTKQGDENRGFAATSSEMKKENTYANWDFDNIWAISEDVNNGFPYLDIRGDYNTFELEGSGTSRDPYIITTEAELAAIARNEITNNYTAYYQLGNDITLSSNYWTPIGGNGMPNFSGEFDGNGHTITNVGLIVPAYYDVGLFGCVTGTIKNLNVKANISDVYTAGSLVGFLYNGTVENCSASGSIIGTTDIGGLVGYMQASDSGNQAIIRNCYSMASATSTSSTEEDGCGGLVGDMYGYNTAPARIFTSYAAGKVTKTGTSGVGGIVGYKHVGNKWSSDGTTGIIASYYCNEMTEQFDTMRGFGITADEMKKQSTYANWDFENIWAISEDVNNGFPYLDIRGDYNTFELEGSGTSRDPYIITTEAELAAIARNEITNNYTAYYQLGNDITLSSNYWTPIGGNGMPNFCGEFDGAGHTISNMSITAMAHDFEGLFGVVEGTVKNLNVIANISNANTVGAITGELYNGTLENCSALGQISGISDIGGLVGYMFASESDHSAILQNCFSRIDLVNTSSAEANGCGGLIGEMYGYNTGANTVSYSYAAGNVTKTGTSGIGGIIGYKHVGNKWSSDGTNTILSCYYDNYSDTSTDKGTYISTEAMKTQSTYTDWDFDTVWAISSAVNDGYPYLRAVSTSAETVAVTGLTLDKTALSVTVGKSGTITANVQPSNATNKNATWTSLKPAVATVTNGKVTGVSEGTTVITAVSEDGSFAATCKVTVTAPVATNYPYVISSLSLVDESGKALTSAPVGKNFIVNAEITETTARDEQDYLFVAVYAKDGTLLSMNYVKCDFITGKPFAIGINIQPQQAEIGSVKAFVWNSFGSMEPLAEQTEL